MRTWRPRLEDSSLPNLTDCHIQSLMAPFMSDEVHRAVFRADGDKAPGPDGFGLLFYQHFWSILKDDIMQVFEEFQKEGKGMGCLNASIFILIPKKEGAESIGKFGPICLVNGGYMLVAKVMAARLKFACADLIDDNQSAFLPGRSLQEGFTFSQEIISSLHKNRRRGAILKLGFSKAFNRFEWNFLFNILERHGFPPLWVKMLANCITMAKASVLVNGTACGFFPIN
ncbi:hypothetical protein QJS10_CPA10g01398 [Acorus calamus]|uniref:Reverse transcriptase domain-containing protein n=1 Tax=Acorus calamus TaxID=4465 RepID=A0AAV9E2G9_ACOCL|nr:hypothetical protein QJS10_CPA10g01398 [Acorus calamus]